MYIPTFVYREFYKILLRHVYDTYLTNEQREKFPKPVGAIWEEIMDKTNQTIFEFLFYPTDNSSDYFSKRVSEHNPELCQYGFVNTALMHRALELLGYKSPAKLVLPKNDPDAKAYVLLQQFMSENCKEQYRSEPDFRVYDEINFKYQGFGLKSKYKAIVREQRLKIDTKVQPDDSTEKRTQEEQIRSRVEEFYTNLTIPDFEAAWNIVAPATQKKRWKDFKHFESGYTNTQAILELHVWNVQVDNRMAHCKVFYMDQVIVRSVPELGGLDSFKISQIESFVERVEKLRQKALKENLPGFDDLEICKLFNPTLSEYYWYTKNNVPEDIFNVFTAPKELSVPRLMHLTLVNDEKNWLIKNFTSVTSQQIR